MSHVQQDEKAPAAAGSQAPPPADTLAANPSAEGLVVIVHMSPDRIAGGLKTASTGTKKKRGGGVSKRYRTSSWFFASDFIDRVAEISRDECSGLTVRPVQIEVTFALDEKAYRHVGLILENFDGAYRAL